MQAVYCTHDARSKRTAEEGSDAEHGRTRATRGLAARKSRGEARGPPRRRSRLERRGRASHCRARLGQGQNYPMGRDPPSHFGQTDKWPLSHLAGSLWIERITKYHRETRLLSESRCGLQAVSQTSRSLRELRTLH